MFIWYSCLKNTIFLLESSFERRKNYIWILYDAGVQDTKAYHIFPEIQYTYFPPVLYIIVQVAYSDSYSQGSSSYSLLYTCIPCAEGEAPASAPNRTRAPAPAPASATNSAPAPALYALYTYLNIGTSVRCTSVTGYIRGKDRLSRSLSWEQ